MRWVENVARTGKKRCAYGVLVGRLREGNNLENLDVDGRIILNGFSRSSMGLDWIDMAQYRKRWVAFVIVVMNLWFS